MPERIQRRRTKGWRMPEGAIYVGRRSRWGNPEVRGIDWLTDDGHWIVLETPEELVAAFRSTIPFHVKLSAWLAPLRGKDLACWCPLDQPCHADVLLEIANV